MAKLTVEIWWSPAAQCWRVEDGEMFTSYELDQAVGHLKDSGVRALVTLTESPKTNALVRALEAAHIEIEYSGQ